MLCYILIRTLLLFCLCSLLPPLDMYGPNQLSDSHYMHAGAPPARKLSSHFSQNDLPDQQIGSTSFPRSYTDAPGGHNLGPAHFHHHVERNFYSNPSYSSGPMPNGESSLTPVFPHHYITEDIQHSLAAAVGQFPVRDNLPSVYSQSVDLDGLDRDYSDSGYRQESQPPFIPDSSHRSSNHQSHSLEQPSIKDTPPARKQRREKPHIALAFDQPPTTQGKPRARVYVACIQW